MGKKEKGKDLPYLAVRQSCSINRKNSKRRSVNTIVKNKNNPWWEKKEKKRKNWKSYCFNFKVSS